MSTFQRASSHGVSHAFSRALLRELRTSWRQLGDVLTPLIFFLIVASLFPLAVGPESVLLKRMGAGIVWVGALLATVLALPRMFQQDFQDGTLEQMMLAPTPLWVTVHAKMLAHILSNGLPLVLMSPILALQLGLAQDELKVLAVSLLLGMPILSYLGGIGAALTLGLRSGGVLVAVLILPLYVPVLIFGAGAVDASSAGLGASAHFSLLAALMIFITFFAPLGITAALKISME
jgi:heme exporter protein B